MSLLSEKQYYELGKFFIDLAKGITIGMFGIATFPNFVSDYFIRYIIITGIVAIGCVTIGLVLIEKERHV